MQKVITKK